MEHDSLGIDTEKNYFIWNSRGRGGNFSQFITAYFDLTGPTVHQRLTDFRQHYHGASSDKQPGLVPKIVRLLDPVQVLDPAGRRYLLDQRHLNADLVTLLANQGLVISTTISDSIGLIVTIG